MTNELAEIRLVLIEGQKLSGQSSYDRRSPNKKAMPKLLQARSRLVKYVESNPNDAEPWRLLSLAEECLLNYPGAETSLERAIKLSSGAPDRRDLKKLALLREYKATWKSLVLEPERLALLGAYLQAQMSVTPCDHTLRMTADWLKRTEIKDASAVLNGLRSQGGYCDCEVLANVVK